MTAAEAIRRAHSAGLTLERSAKGFKVLGPKAARLALRPAFMSLSDEIVRLLPGPVSSADPRRCSDCGRSGFTLMMVTGCGDHLCRGCWRETTSVPDVRQPPTPVLDRLMARVECGERGGAA